MKIYTIFLCLLMIAYQATGMDRQFRGLQRDITIPVICCAAIIGCAAIFFAYIRSSSSSSTCTVTGNDHTRGASLANKIVGSGVKKTREIVLQEPVHEFICSVGKAQLEWGTSNCVAITADDNIEPLLDATYSLQKLICWCTKDKVSLHPKVPIQFHVTLENQSYIKMLQASGSAAINCDRSLLISKDILILKVSGNGSITMSEGHNEKIDVKKVHLSAQGNGKTIL